MRNPVIAGIVGSVLLAGAFVGYWDGVRAMPASPKTSPTESFLSLSFPDPKDGFVSATKGNTFYLLATHDAGLSWQHFRLNFGIDTPSVAPSDTTAGMDAIQFSDASTGWIMGYSLTKCQPEVPQGQDTCDDSLYATRDGGRHWMAEISLGQFGLLMGFQFLNRSVGWAMTSRCHIPGSAVRRDAGAGMVCGFDERILATTDGGRKWSRANWKLNNVEMFHFANAHFGWAISGPPPDPNTGMRACGSTVSATEDGGRHWTRVLYLGNECQAIGWFSGARDAWVASNQNAKCDSDGCPTEVLRQTRNGGKTWTMPQSLHSQKWTGMTGFAQELQFASGRRGWLTFQLGSSLNTAGGIAATADGGRTWKRYLPCYEVEPGGVASVAADTLWLAGNWVSYCSQARQSGLFRSIDWGAHWQQVRPHF